MGEEQYPGDVMVPRMGKTHGYGRHTAQSTDNEADFAPTHLKSKPHQLLTCVPDLNLNDNEEVGLFRIMIKNN